MKTLFTATLMLIVNVLFAQENPGLTAVFDKDKQEVKLSWQHVDEAISLYTLQKSSDNIFFTDIYTKKTTGLEEGRLLKFIDEHASATKNYYRLKIFRGTSTYEATLPVTVISGNTNKGWVIYPVPVGTILHLQYNGTSRIEGVISVQIQNVNSGRIFNRMRMASTTRNIDIPVDNLGTGIYDIRIFVGTEVTWNQRFAK